MIGVNASMTDATCADACWYARQDVCRCSCGGANHGILLTAGEEKPARTRRVGKYRFKLAGIVAGYRNAREYSKGLYEAIGETRPPFSHAIKPSWGESPKFAISGATDAQVNSWSELQPYQGWREKGQCYAEAEQYRPYLIWERTN